MQGAESRAGRSGGSCPGAQAALSARAWATQGSAFSSRVRYASSVVMFKWPETRGQGARGPRQGAQGQASCTSPPEFLVKM